MIMVSRMRVKKSDIIYLAAVVAASVAIAVSSLWYAGAFN
jgi:hypothetical protein